MSHAALATLANRSDQCGHCSIRAGCSPKRADSYSDVSCATGPAISIGPTCAANSVSRVAMAFFSSRLSQAAGASRDIRARPARDSLLRAAPAAPSAPSGAPSFRVRAGTAAARSRDGQYARQKIRRIFRFFIERDNFRHHAVAFPFVDICARCLQNSWSSCRRSAPKTTDARNRN